MGYDIIGDIHGQGAKLWALLAKLGYVRRSSAWAPPRGRHAIFLGDLIDRGAEQVEVVKAVRAMIDNGHARSVMGNHEFNALGYATLRLDGSGEYARVHSAKNVAQHIDFLRQVGEGTNLHREILDWFRTLPPALDLGDLRIVHAWWHQPYVDRIARQIRPGHSMSDEFLLAAHDEGSAEWAAMEGLTKGLELGLPEGHSIVDYSGVERDKVRVRWWHENPRTFRDIAIVDDSQHHRVPDHPLPADYRGQAVEGGPVFVGHYWLVGEPALQTPKVACVDYSAAKGGPLVAYRWDGEVTLNPRHFVAAG